MKKYDAYKPSGIGWIGEIPEGWEKCRFKNFLTLINKPSISDTKVGLENIESGSGKYLPSDSEFDGNGVEFLIDDILYGKLRPYLMKVWVAEFTGNAVGDFFVFRAKKNANPYFLKYLMLSDGFTKEADGATEGAKMPRVSSEFIMSLRYYLPSKKEQIAIAYYLDAKCANIDNVVAIQRKRIELLKELKQSIITHAVTKGLDKTAKMKDSGIDWIGKIPEGWEKCRFKNFLILINKPSISDAKIGLENIESGSGKFLPSDSEFDGNGVEFIRNDIVYGKLRPYLMKVWVAEFTGNAVGDFFVFRAKKNANPNFIKYLMLSDGYTKKADGATVGAKMPRVSSNFILTLKYYLPSKEEQTAIADYLDKKCTIINKQIAKVEKQIELLNEYKQSVITECVTGKRKVC